MKTQQYGVVPSLKKVFFQATLSCLLILVVLLSPQNFAQSKTPATDEIPEIFRRPASVTVNGEQQASPTLQTQFSSQLRMINQFLAEANNHLSSVNQELDRLLAISASSQGATQSAPVLLAPRDLRTVVTDFIKTVYSRVFSFSYGVVKHSLTSHLSDAHKDAVDKIEQLVYNRLSSLFATAQSSSSSSITVSNKWPEQLDNVNGWIGYGIYLGIIFIIPLIICILLLLVLGVLGCTKCCCCCCWANPLYKEDFEGYSSLSVKSTVGVYVFFFLLVAGLSIIGIIFTALFSVQVTKVSKEGWKNVNDGFNLVSNIKNTLNSVLGEDINNAIDNILDFVAGFNQFKDPVRNMVGIFNHTIDELDGIAYQLGIASSNLTVIKEKVAALKARGEIEGVPDVSSIPSLDNMIPIVDTAKSALRQGISQVDTVDGTIDSAVVQVQTQIKSFNGTIKDIVSGVSGSADKYLTQADSVINQYASTQQRAQYEQYTYTVESVRVSIFIVLYCIVPIVYAIGVFLACFSVWYCMDCLACLSYFVMILYFLACSIQLVIFLFFYDTCRELEPAITKAENMLVKSVPALAVIQIPNPGGGQPYNTTITKIMNSILQCQGDTTFLDAFGLDIQAFVSNSSVIDDAKVQIQAQIDKFNVSTVLATAKNQISNFSGNVLDFNFDILNNVTAYTAQLDQIIGQLTNFTRFNFSVENYAGELQKVNDITNPYGLYYSFDNITSLDVNDPHFASLPPQDRQTLTDTKNSIVNLQQKYNETMALMADIQVNVTIARNSLNNILGAGNVSVETYGRIKQTPSSLLDQITNLERMAENIKQNASQLIADTFSVVGLIGNKVESLASCASIGGFYRETKTSICTNCSAYMIILALISGILGLLVAALYPVLLTASRRMQFSKNKTRKNKDKHAAAEHSAPATIVQPDVNH